MDTKDRRELGKTYLENSDKKDEEKANNRRFMESDLAKSGIDKVPTNYTATDIGFDIAYMNPKDGKPLLWEEKKDGKVIGCHPFVRTKLKIPKGDQKYTQPFKSGVKPYFPLGYLEAAKDMDTVYITEGEKKADSATLYGLPTIGLGGIWSFADKDTEDGIKTLMEDLTPYIKKKKVVMIFDSDCIKEDKIRNFNDSANTFAWLLKSHKASLSVVRLPNYCGDKTGLDDFIVMVKEKGKLDKWIQYFDLLPRETIIPFYDSSKKIYNAKVAELLAKNGNEEYVRFYPFPTANIPSDPIFVKRDGPILTESSSSLIRTSFKNILKNNYPEKVFNVYAKNPEAVLGNSKLELLEEVKTIEHKDTMNEIFLYFEDTVYVVTAEDVKPIPYSAIKGHIWKSSTIKHKLEIKENWEESEWYQYLTKIAGGDEATLNALCGGAAYLIHTFKKESLNVGVFLTDGHLETDQGGTGKGIFFKALDTVRSVCNLDMRSRVGNQFLLSGVKPYHNIIHLEDVPPSFLMGSLYNANTSDLEVEEKNKGRMVIPYEFSPKIGISTNFAIGSLDNAARRRRYEIPLFPHYGADFTPEDDFGHLLLSNYGWDKEEWNLFYSCIINQCQEYLRNGLPKFSSHLLDDNRLVESTDKDFPAFMEKYKIELGKTYFVKDIARAFNMEFRIGKFREEVDARKFRKWIDQYAVASGYNIEGDRGYKDGQQDRTIRFVKKKDK